MQASVDIRDPLPEPSPTVRAEPVRRLIRRIAAAVPTGNTLPAESWRRRHHGILLFLWGHVLVIPWMGVVTHHGLGHALFETLPVIAFAFGASRSQLSKHAREVLATLGLTTCSAVLTHLSGGLIEMHFHFFVVVALVTLYQSWLPFGVSIAYVVVHHGVAGAFDPASVFNHPAALASPWKWAAIHGLFISAESTVCLIAWRLNEVAMHSERSARLELQEANEDLAEAQSLARVGSYEWDTATGAMWWSNELYRIFGLDPGQYRPTLDGFIELVHPDDRYRIGPAVEEALGTRSAVELEARVVRPDGETVIIRAIGSTPGDDAPSTRLVGTVQDITDLRHLEEEIRHRAFHDPLTDLANRALLLERLTHPLSRREPVPPMALLFVDLDEFKAINDSLGHGVGDEVLRGFARRLETLIRPSDTAARLGGDEFAVLLEDAGETVAIEVAERILASLGTPFTIADHEVFVRASIGIATAGPQSTSDVLLRDADIAVYAAKAEGKHRFRLCTADLRRSASEDRTLRRELVRAVDRGEFLLHYQPIVDLESERIQGLEALVRWNHPKRGIVPPLEFIPLAEETGVIVELGTWVLQEATRRARELQDELGRPLSISVNLSTKQLEQSDVVEVVAAALRDSGLAPEHLILEITETGMLANAETGTRRLQGLRALGVRIAVDDFGTGYSSLSYLHSFPVDILKIDRSFITAATDGSDEGAVAKAIVQLGSTLRLRTVAEGIETAEQLNTLRGLGCETGQGMLFSAPVELGRIREQLLEDAAASSRILASS